MPADVHIDNQDLCLACARAEELDLDDGDKIAHESADSLPGVVEPPAVAEDATTEPAKEIAPIRERQPIASKAKERPKKLCEHCGNEFSPKQDRSRFCSPQCTDSFWHKHHCKTAGRPKRKCDGRDCGKEFTPVREDQHFCSTECKNSARRRDSAKPNSRSVRPSQESIKQSAPENAMPSAGGVIGEHVELVSILVSAKALDRFWSALTLVEKAAIVERELSR